MSDKLPFIRLENVSLKLPVARLSKTNNEQNAVGGRIVREKNSNHILALDNINLDVRPGSRVAIVGANGAGKTTLLRMASGIYHPTSGQRRVNGRVTCLLSSSIGLSPALTGYENINLACLLYGLSRAEIIEATPGIVAFSELGSYLEMPLRSYSAGMRTRLGISIITALRPDVLLIDEVFGAGDARFAEKSREKLLSILEQSRILMFASHSESLLHTLCNEAILMDHGKLVMRGTVAEVLLEYKMITI